MNIYIDESGSFVNAPVTGKWNAVAALAVPETERKKLEHLVHRLKTSTLGTSTKEVKLHELTEDAYIKFIADLANLNVAVFCTATDAGLNTTVSVLVHQKHQTQEILRHLDKMKYEGGRQGVMLMAAQLEKLPVQLYVQLICQMDLMFDVVSRVITYFAQHSPSALREFRWRVDQKNSSRTDFEDAFEKLSPALLQTMSMDEPLMMVKGFDYSGMSQYEFKDGNVPEYLRQDYGIEVTNALNIQKLVRGNIKFMDSADSLGIQTADLVVSGIRRCLRKQFSNNDAAATLLGKLMLQAKHNSPSLNLISFADDAPLETGTASIVRTMSANSKRMVK